MTKCSREAIRFTGLSRRQVVADFLGGRLTSDAGILLLREMERELGLIDAINECLPDPRDPRYVIHEQRVMLAQRIMALALGYEDLNDHETLRNDPALQTSVQADPRGEQPLASPPTLCRLENRVTRKALFAMSKVLVDQFVASRKKPPKEIVLDFDATDDPVHGSQIGRFFHGYYDHYCFLPLYVFCGEQLLCAYLRPSNIDAALHSGAILRLLVNYLRRFWPKTKIIMRGDSGFCRWRVMRWCEKHDVSYIFGIARNSVLEKKIAKLEQLAEQQFAKTHRKQRLFGETRYEAETWDRPRRVIMKAERLPKGPNNRFVVTNLPGEPNWLYDRLYVKRGEMENRIKEQQRMLFADRTSCHDFEANQFRLLLSSFAYVLIQQLRQRHLAKTELSKAQVDTIRLKLLKVSASVVVSVRRVVFHMASSYPYQALFRHIAGSILLRPG